MNFTLPAELAQSFMLVFARIGSLIMILPLIGERFVLVRARLVFAVLISIVLVPVIRPMLPDVVASDPSRVIGALFVEILIGLMIGLSVRLVIVAAEMAGQLISQSLGLALGEVLNPTYDGQASPVGTFMTLTVLAFMFATDAHHVVIGALVGSYKALPPVQTFLAGDALQFALSAATRGMLVAVQLSAPLLVFSFLLNAGLGIISKLMPQIQVAYVAAPITALVGAFILIVVMAAMIERLAGEVLESLKPFVAG